MDVTCAQALAYSGIDHAVSRAHSQLSISIDPNAPAMVDKPKKRRLHIEERCKPALLHPSVHSRSRFRDVTKTHRPRTRLDNGDPHPASVTELCRLLVNGNRE